MLKWIGIALAAAACAGYGYLMGRELQRRVRHLQELQRMMYMLRGEIQYNRAPVGEAFVHIAGRMTPPFSDFLLNAAAGLESFDGETFREIWEVRIETDLAQTCLTAEDKRRLGQLGEQIGYLDQEMQVNAVRLYLEQLELDLGALRASEGEKVRVYRTLGIMGALFFVILFL